LKIPFNPSMDNGKFEECMDSLELVLTSLERILKGISENRVSTEDIERVHTGLESIQRNTRSCL
jgi:hypothetical protein